MVFGLVILVLWVYVWLAREKRNHELVQATFVEALTQLAYAKDIQNIYIYIFIFDMLLTI